MTAAQKLLETYEQLPEELQIELLDFTNYLAEKSRLDAEHKRAEIEEMLGRIRAVDDGSAKVIPHSEMMKRLRS